MRYYLDFCHKYRLEPSKMQNLSCELFLRPQNTKPRSPSIQSNGVFGRPWSISNPLSLSLGWKKEFGSGILLLLFILNSSKSQWKPGLLTNGWSVLYAHHNRWLCQIRSQLKNFLGKNWIFLIASRLIVIIWLWWAMGRGVGRHVNLRVPEKLPSRYLKHSAPPEALLSSIRRADRALCYVMVMPIGIKWNCQAWFRLFSDNCMIKSKQLQQTPRAWPAWVFFRQYSGGIPP